MLLSMKLDRKVHELDCIAVDGGYTHFLKKLVEVSDKLSLHNFAHPCCKKKAQELTEQESACHRDGHLYSHVPIPHSCYSLTPKKIYGHVT